MKDLKLGVAYHSNRLFSHVEADMKELVESGFNLVCHMFTHTDWVRCPSVMKDIFAMSEGLGLEVWVDNWGLNGAPGDPSFFLNYHPTEGQILSDGSVHPRVCLNSEAFIAWTKEWIDKVYECGGRQIFWDEPALLAKETFACACPRCQKLYEERYGKKMPRFHDESVAEFQLSTILNYFTQVTAYVREKGMKNLVCVMPGRHNGICVQNTALLFEHCSFDNVGTDPYCISIKKPNGKSHTEAYSYVYNHTKDCLAITEGLGLDHNLWIQAYNIPAGDEEKIVTMADAAYEAGARTILFWGHHGCEGNEYRSEHPLKSWASTKGAVAHLLRRERQRIVTEAKKELGIL